AGAQTGGPWSALAIDSPESVIEGIRIEINGASSGKVLYGISLKGGSHKITDCEIVQALPQDSIPGRQMAGVLVQAPRTGGCSLDLGGTLFVGYPAQEKSESDNPLPDRMPHWLVTRAASRAQDAVVCRGPVKLTVRDCAFGPHGSLFVV